MVISGLFVKEKVLTMFPNQLNDILMISAICSINYYYNSHVRSGQRIFR